MDNTLYLTNIPRELKLIVELLKEGNETYVQEHQEKLCKDIDWDLFIKQVKHHRVYPLLDSKVRLLDERFVPVHVRKFLSNQYKRNTFQMLNLAAEMECVSKLFEEQIRLLFLKGPILAQNLYGDISQRTSSDLDILIPINQLQLADKLLKGIGYEKDDYIQTVLYDWKWRHHHVTYFNPQKNIKLEIHWRLHPGPCKEPKFDELWKRRNSCALTTTPVYLLGTEDLFLFLVSHGARHGWSRLRWLLDINQLIKRDIDWKKAYTLLKKNHQLHVGGQGYILASELFNSVALNKIEPLLTKRAKRLAQEAVFYLENMVNLHTNPVPEKISRYHKRHLFSLMPIQQKFLFILSFLYPYPEDAETLPLPKKLHFLYFPLRPILWAIRKRKKHALP
ncbi:nucleotidyltransferase domain-containing protein [Lentibacillus sp. Marseille-P4043]|uniref:nucleotidyltransferase domain-containing protein n=1 Tax=Lentibacillus sp. Marseille-P4043 TaxID=2040293 RepID=UPI000D0AF749|nr:nucleotidyltransferase family protein [Lentibacillus sp. Marseille-P4043]